MNESTPFGLPDETFAVFQFSLGPTPGSGPRQSVRNLGDYGTIEEAFAAARRQADREARAAALVAAATPDGSGDAMVNLLSTEFGYDVRQGCQILTRLWILARPVLAA